MKRELEINEVIEKCHEAVDNEETNFYSMTYEEGVKNALEWVLGDGEDPFE